MKGHPYPPTPHKIISKLSKTHGKAMFVLLMPEQGKKSHDQDQSAHPSNQKICNEAKFYQWLVEEGNYG
jgi:hypothetical protein